MERHERVLFWRRPLGPTWETPVCASGDVRKIRAARRRRSQGPIWKMCTRQFFLLLGVCFFFPLRGKPSHSFSLGGGDVPFAIERPQSVLTWARCTAALNLRKIHGVFSFFPWGAFFSVWGGRCKRFFFCRGEKGDIF